MTRTALLLAALAAILAGCPLPQAVPTYPPGTVTPPRIVMDELLGDGAVIFVPANCTTAPTYILSPRVIDTNTFETIEARWFVNYDFRDVNWYHVQQSDPIPPNADTTNLTRNVPPFAFAPYSYSPPYDPSPTATITGPSRDAGITRVVEVVVSNGFEPILTGTTAAGPGVNRSAVPGFETQYYRWVYVTVPPSVPPSSFFQCPQ